jgi:hypothetical protein
LLTRDEQVRECDEPAAHGGTATSA